MQEREVRERATGEKLCTITASYFLRGDGGFGGPQLRQPEPHPIPERAPDLVKECDTRPDQAFLYALSGDRNPLHRDPAVAKMAGFPRPILHGMCSYGTACRAVLSSVGKYQSERIKQFDVRFSKPVFPGETIVTEMWVDGGTVSFRATVKERAGVVVLNNGLCVLS
jgi:acyl dehydratase